MFYYLFTALIAVVVVYLLIALVIKSLVVKVAREDGLPNAILKQRLFPLAEQFSFKAIREEYMFLTVAAKLRRNPIDWNEVEKNIQTFVAARDKIATDVINEFREMELYSDKQYSAELTFALSVCKEFQHDNFPEFKHRKEIIYAILSLVGREVTKEEYRGIFVKEGSMPIATQVQIEEGINAVVNKMISTAIPSLTKEQVSKYTDDILEDWYSNLGV